jgi:hypothetical protein
LACYHKSRTVRLLAFEIFDLLCTLYNTSPTVSHTFKIVGLETETVKRLSPEKALFLVTSLIDRRLEIVEDPSKLSSYMSQILADRYFLVN